VWQPGDNTAALRLEAPEAVNEADGALQSQAGGSKAEAHTGSQRAQGVRLKDGKLVPAAAPRPTRMQTGRSSLETWLSPKSRRTAAPSS
jgi:hypothetical protein